MKQCILFIIVLLISNNVFAQNHSDIYAKASDMEVTDKKTKFIPSTFGLYGMGYFITGTSYGIGDGGGLGFNYKANINKYFGVATHFTYTYAEYKELQNRSHLIDTKILLVLQRETPYPQF